MSGSLPTLDEPPEPGTPRGRVWPPFKWNVRKRLFIAEYLANGFNGTHAAIAAGYSKRGAKDIAYELLQRAEIQAAVAERVERRIQSAELTADRVLEEMRRLAFFDIRCLFDGAGKLKPLRELTDEQAAALASCEIVIKNIAAGDGKTDTVHKLKAYDKTKALEMLGKHFALLTEHVAISGLDDLLAQRKARLSKARERAKR